MSRPGKIPERACAARAGAWRGGGGQTALRRIQPDW